MEIYVKYLFFEYVLFFLVLKHDFTKCINFTRIAA